MSCSQPYAEKLQSLGYRMTPQRHVILHVLRSSGGHLTPAQIFERARATTPGMTETTVYRTLEFLTENNIVQSKMTGSGHQVYEIAEADHYHLVCRKCGSEVEIRPDPIQFLYHELEKTTRFQSVDGRITFFGLCPACQE